jgi:hypothetical protein
MSSPINPAYIGLAISPSDTNEQAHDRSDMYVGWRTTAGAFIVMDGYSNSQSQPQWDTVQNVQISSGSLTGNTLTLTFSRPLIAKEASDISIVQDNLMLGWALGAQNGVVQGNQIEQHASSANARGGAMVNFMTGASEVDSHSSNDPGTQYAITLVFFTLLYSVIQFSYRFFKIYKKDKKDKNDILKPQSGNLSSPLPVKSANDAEFEQYDEKPYNSDFNSTGAYYFRGSVAVLYNEELRSHAGVQVAQQNTANSTKTDTFAGKISKYINFESDSSSEKQFGSPLANTTNKFLNKRVPYTQVAVKDLLVGIFVFLLNIGFAEIWRAKGYSSGEAWGYLAAANSFFVA